MKSLSRSESAKDIRTSRRRRFGRKRLGPFLAGLLIGGIIPSITWNIAHHQVEARPMLWLAVAGGLAYSAPMVATWFARYSGPIKAWGFVVSLEVAMTFTEGWTPLAALVVLTALNGYILAGRFSND